MEYWIFLNNEKQGPYTLTDLQQVELSPDTLVWRDGLNRWVEAQEIEELEILFATKQPPTFEEEAKSNQSNVNCNNIPPVYLPQEKEVTPPQYIPQPQTIEPAQEQQKPCPPNYLVWAILSTLCCCQPLGIVAIIFAANVNSKYNRGDYEGAVKNSERAALWVILSFVIGLATLPIQMLVSLL